MRNPRDALQVRLKAVTVSKPEVPGLNIPFVRIDEALYPYRAGNRCALNSLDTDRSTTRSLQTVTAKLFICSKGEEYLSARIRPTKYFAWSLIVHRRCPKVSLPQCSTHP
jgi:hypothetical protein